MFLYAWVIIAHWGFWCGDFLCLIDISICDIDMMKILINSLACLSILILLLPWLSCSLWHVCSHCCTSCLSRCQFSCLYIILIIFLACYLCCYSFWLSYSHLACVWTWMIYKRFVWLPVAWMLFSCVFAWLFVYVGCISIPLPPILWFRPFPSFQFLHLQVWGLVCSCSSD